MDDMRHNLPSPWEHPELAQSLAGQPGVGKARQAALAAKGLFTMGDALWWLPVSYEDRSHSHAEPAEGQFALLELTLQSSRAWGPGGRAWRMEFSDQQGRQITAIWFRFNRAYINGFKTGQTYLLAGQADRDKKGLWTFIHPRLYDTPEQAGVGRIWPIYGQVPGMGQAHLRQLMGAIAARLAPLAPDFLYNLLPRQIYPMPLGQALLKLHLPEDTHSFSQARQSLVADELFYFELALSLKRRQRQTQQAPALPHGQEVIQKFKASLPFSLTPGQEKALQQTAEDLARATPMARLLCGDVGTGKTLVALAAAAMAWAGGRKSVFMAPTEILARQHEQSARLFLKPLGMRTALVLGGDKSPLPEAHLYIGTQALLWRKDELRGLGLVIIDEQHRFGVGQRFGLIEHDMEPHVLVLSATPIPRSLALALSGYMDISDLPRRVQQQNIATFLAPYAQREKPLAALKTCLENGSQAYVVCAFLEPSDNSHNWDAISTYQRLSRYFAPLAVGLVHGQMSSLEQQTALDDFKSGRTRLLVATTVVEVGVDVPQASTMLVLSAERFGLSQLHQIRGRVGRGAEPGQCWLMAGQHAPEHSLNRLETLCNTQDGLSIAEADLALRGPGETLGYRQSGLPPFRIANWIKDAPLAAELRQLITQRKLNENRQLLQESLRRYGARLGLVHSG